MTPEIVEIDGRVNQPISEVLMTNEIYKPTANKRSVGLGFQAAVVLAACFACPIASADQALEQRFPGYTYVAVKDLPALGSVPTIFVNLDASRMLELIRDDLQQGRRPFDVQKPSALEPYVTKMLHFPVGGSSRNGFMQGNSNICFTAVNAQIPAWNNQTQVPASFTAPLTAWRSCAMGFGAPVSRGSIGLKNLYTSFGVKIIYDPVGYRTQAIIPIAQGPTASNMPTEPAMGWGTSFFDTSGTAGRLQEIFWIDATYTMN